MKAKVKGRRNGPIFLSGPDGGGKCEVNADWAEAISQFFETVKKILGPDPVCNVWPYRHGGYMSLACDLEGDLGEVSLTITEARAVYSGKPYIPVYSEAKEGSNWVCEPVVEDGVDAFYFVSELIKFLGISGPAIRLKAGPLKQAKEKSIGGQ